MRRGDRHGLHSAADRLEVLPVLVDEPDVLALGSFSTRCVWNFGNVLPTTNQTFGKDAQYGTPNVARFAGTSTSVVLPNPQFTGGCKR